MPGPYKSLPLATQLGEGLSPYASDAELVNLMLVPNPPGSRTPFYVQQIPAITAGFSQDQTLRVRGMCFHSDKVFFIQGTEVKYTSDGATVTTVPAGVAVAGSNMCQMVDAGTHVVIVNRDAGTSYTATTATVAEITEPAGSYRDVTYMDGYTIYARAGTDEFYISALEDPATIAALDFSTADALPGNIVGLIADHKELIIFKQRSTEFWYNSGAADFPFARSSPGVAERGCFAEGSIAKYDNRVFWLGDDLRVYAMQGYQPTPISTPWMNREILGLDINPYSVRGSTYVHLGRAYYMISLSVFSGSSGANFVYDIDAGLWHKRSPSIFTSVTDAVTYSNNTDDIQTLVACLTTAGGSGVYVMSSALYADSGAGSNESRTMTLPAVAANGERVFMHELYLDMEKNAAASTVNLSYSDDGGATYSSSKAADGTLARCRWNRLGAFRQRILRFSLSTNSRIAIMGVHARIEAGL